MYFAIYQALAKGDTRPGLHREQARDVFDLVSVDECPRGRARDDSNWREVLTWFDTAYQIGMTATPLREESRDADVDFNDPIDRYRLRRGIEDGFRAPHRVPRVITGWDAAGRHPSQDELDSTPCTEKSSSDNSASGLSTAPSTPSSPPSSPPCSIAPFAGSRSAQAAVRVGRLRRPRPEVQRRAPGSATGCAAGPCRRAR